MVTIICNDLLQLNKQLFYYYFVAFYVFSLRRYTFIIIISLLVFLHYCFLSQKSQKIQILLLLLFDLIPSPALQMFQLRDDDHISPPICNLEIQHFPWHLSCSKDCCHLCTASNVRYPQGVLQGRKFPENSPECTKRTTSVVASLYSQFLVRLHFHLFSLHKVQHCLSTHIYV